MIPYHLRHVLRGILIRALISGTVTAFYMYLFVHRDLISIATGLFIGGLILILLEIYSMTLFERYIKRKNLTIVLTVNTLVYALTILAIAILGVGVFYLNSRFSLLFSNIAAIKGYFLAGLAFGLLVSLGFNFVSIVSTIIGRNTLARLFLGRYRKPHEVERIVMFLDVRSSTTLAERIGHAAFLSLMNDFFYDLSVPVLRTGGEIYKYVGDEAIVVWKMKRGLKDAACIRCFFMLHDRLKGAAAKYLKNYGIIPEFKAGMHCGPVISGEMGYHKREIAYMGDVMNTAARIQQECNTYGTGLLVSADLIEKMNLPAEFTLTDLGQVQLRGKNREIQLYSLNRQVFSESV
ncbi:MAG: hypothetical protein JW861_04105 [Bacteroidales bacterium]|nr:hypothetical protein [Bacteroidales bacterium]